MNLGEAVYQDSVQDCPDGLGSRCKLECFNRVGSFLSALVAVAKFRGRRRTEPEELYIGVLSFSHAWARGQRLPGRNTSDAPVGCDARDGESPARPVSPLVARLLC
jgi:hypothetical protein